MAPTVILTHPPRTKKNSDYAVPGPPGAIDILEVSPGEVTMSWSAPVPTADAPVIGYQVGEGTLINPEIFPDRSEGPAGRGLGAGPRPAAEGHDLHK